MRLLICGAVGVMWAGAALAADKPVMAPPPPWVHPAAFPTDLGKPDSAPIRLLLEDQQVHFGDEGTTIYSETVMQLQTPQGLSAGSISFPWNPDTDTLTVHKLLIHRGDKVIDVLASGQTFTVIRRESNLENAVLDGVLTANIQPEGLQVGDVIDFSASLTRNDPALKGHREELVNGWGILPLGKLQVSLAWPKGVPMRWREVSTTLPLTKQTAGATTSVSLSASDLKTAELPSDAPARFRMLPQIEFTDFKSWADVGTLLAPLYEKAAALPADGKLAAEIAHIAAASSDPKVRAEAALKLVQDRVRYVFLGMNDGGLVPADAETTWARRFGDCKGKTALLLALLKGLGIPAEPVIVSTTGGDGMDQRLPMVALFDHVLVRATIAGRPYWLDGTRTGDTDLDAIRTPGFEWGLPLQPTGAALVRLVQTPLDKPADDTAIRLDASAGLSIPAPAHVEEVFRGDAAMGLNLQLAAMDADTLDRALRKYWQGQYDFIDVTSATAAFDPKTGEEKLVMDGTAKMDWEYSRYETDGTGQGYKADFTRTVKTNADAPYAVSFPSYNRVVETIVLPNDGKGFTISDGADVTQTIAGTEYHRHAAITGATATIEASTRTVADEFPASQATAAQAALRALNKQTVYVYEPTYYAPTKAEVDAAMKQTPTTADAFTTRGNMLMDHGRLDEALADFNQAITLDPKASTALADRALVHFYKRDTPAAEKDIASALAADPNNAVAYRARAMIAMARNDYPAAATAFSRSLEIEHDNLFALQNRAVSYEMSADYDRALADANRVIELAPAMVDAYLLRANLYRRKQDDVDALAQATAVTKTNPDDPAAYTIAGAIYKTYHKTDDAMQAFGRSIDLKPTIQAYLTRMNARPKEDVAGRRSDVEAALKLDPKSVEAIASKASIQEDAGDYKGAITTLSAALALQPKNFNLLTQRGVDYARSDQPDLAEKDYAAARAATTDPVFLNNICWMKATKNVSLASALADCDMALKGAPDQAGYEDSRGLVLLRLGRTDEAIAQYDKALAKQPDMASSLYGRAIAEARKGDSARSAADVAAAKKADQNIADEYDGYGLKP